MQIHTFRADSLQAALQQVRKHLGPDASILHTRERRQNRLGWFSKMQIEVEATLDMPVPSRFSGETPATARRPASGQAAVRQASAEFSGTASRIASPAEPGRDRGPKSEPLSEAQSGTLPAGAAEGPRSASGHSAKSASGVPASVPNRADADQASLPREVLSAAMLEIHADLLASGVPHVIASRLLSDVLGGAGDRMAAAEREDPWAVRGRLGQCIASKLKVAGSIELGNEGRKVVALIGPTGVGKTTTLAKIAAGFRFDLGCQVGLVALDTFRLGAVDQLLQYAELISAPLEVVSSAEQVTSALERLSGCDLVLLDTAGRAPRDSEQLAELHKFLSLAQPHSTQLVVSATSAVGHIEQTLQQFAILSPTNLLITKLDEAVGFGSWLELLHACPLPISYLTNGQHVPQDIVVASARRMASLLLGNHQPSAGNSFQTQGA